MDGAWIRAAYIVADRYRPADGVGRFFRTWYVISTVWVARGWRTTLARHDRGGQQLLIGVGVLLGLDVVGGLLAIANDVNTPAEAWSSKATLAAPVPMIAAQAVLAGAAAYWPDRRGAAAAGVLATACVVSGVSGFFDGQFGRQGLPRPLIAFQAALVGATFGVGGLAIARAVRLARRRV